MRRTDYSIAIYRSQFIIINMINIKNNPSPGLLIASTNKGKLREFRALLEPAGLLLVTPDEIGLDLSVEEDGLTYRENAGKKAAAYCLASGLPILADDTGLEVDLLDGRPGLHSARYSPIPGATDADRRAQLLAELSSMPQPWLAHFHCCVAVAFPGMDIAYFDGNVFGEIVTEERGEHGFGYDRLFWIPAAGKRLAELDLLGKNAFSHRAVAVKKAIPYLIEKMGK